MGAAAVHIAVWPATLAWPTSAGGPSAPTARFRAGEELGKLRSSSASRFSLYGAGFLRGAPRRPPSRLGREGRDVKQSSTAWNHMAHISYSSAVCATVAEQSNRRADRAPGRCRAGEGLAWR